MKVSTSVFTIHYIAFFENYFDYILSCFLKYKELKFCFVFNWGKENVCFFSFFLELRLPVINPK